MVVTALPLTAVAIATATAIVVARRPSPVARRPSPRAWCTAGSGR
ncbi:hypothetical protein ACIBUR_01830 [Streptomyces anulatus]